MLSNKSHRKDMLMPPPPETFNMLSNESHRKGMTLLKHLDVPKSPSLPGILQLTSIRSREGHCFRFDTQTLSCKVSNPDHRSITCLLPRDNVCYVQSDQHIKPEPHVKFHESSVYALNCMAMLSLKI